MTSTTSIAPAAVRKWRPEQVQALLALARLLEWNVSCADLVYVNKSLLRALDDGLETLLRAQDEGGLDAVNAAIRTSQARQALAEHAVAAGRLERGWMSQIDVNRPRHELYLTLAPGVRKAAREAAQGSQRDVLQRLGFAPEWLDACDAALLPADVKRPAQLDVQEVATSQQALSMFRAHYPLAMSRIEDSRAQFVDPHLVRLMEELAASQRSAIHDWAKHYAINSVLAPTAIAALGYARTPETLRWATQRIESAMERGLELFVHQRASWTQLREAGYADEVFGDSAEQADSTQAQPGSADA